MFYLFLCCDIIEVVTKLDRIDHSNSIYGYSQLFMSIKLGFSYKMAVPFILCIDIH